MSNNKNRILFSHETSKVGIGTDNPHSALHIIETDVFGTHPTVQLEAPDPSIVFSDTSNNDAKFSIRYNAAVDNEHTGLQFFNTLSDNTPMLNLHTSNCVGINASEGQLRHGASLVVSTVGQWSETGTGTQAALIVGGPDTQRQPIHIHAQAYDFPGNGQTTGTGSSYSAGAFWASPMIYRSGDWQGTTPRPFPFDQWGELILQGTSYGASYNKGISFVTWDGTQGTKPAIRMRIKENGNVGIGNTNPEAKLHVSGEIHLDQRIYSGSDSTHFGELDLYDSSGDTVFDRHWSGGTSDFIVKHNGRTQLIIKENDSVSFGIPANGANNNGSWLRIEGNTGTDGEGSGRIFFAEHNNSQSGTDAYGLSIGYRGGQTAISTAAGNTWTGLSQVSNGEWGFWGHSGSNTGTLVMRGNRQGDYVDFIRGGMRVFQDRVGIGTTNPSTSYKLDVAGDARIGDWISERSFYYGGSNYSTVARYILLLRYDTNSYAAGKIQGFRNGDTRGSRYIDTDFYANSTNWASDGGEGAMSLRLGRMWGPGNLGGLYSVVYNGVKYSAIKISTGTHFHDMTINFQGKAGGTDSNFFTLIEETSLTSITSVSQYKTLDTSIYTYGSSLLLNGGQLHVNGLTTAGTGRINVYSGDRSNDEALMMWETPGTSAMGFRTHFNLSDAENAFSIYTKGYNNEGDKVTFKVDGRVGIGTTTPDTRLHVNDNINGINSGLLISNYNTTAGTGQQTRLLFGLARNSGSLKPAAGEIRVGKIQDWTDNDQHLDSYMQFKVFENMNSVDRLRITPHTVDITAYEVPTGTTPAFRVFNRKVSSTPETPTTNLYGSGIDLVPTGDDGSTSPFIRFYDSATNHDVDGTTVNDLNWIVGCDDTNTSSFRIQYGGGNNSTKLKRINHGSTRLFIDGPTGKVGITTPTPEAMLDVPVVNTKVTRFGNDITTHYVVTGAEDHTLTFTCGSYYQAEVVITANQTNNSSSGNNLYIRGIWHNNYTNHAWDELEHVGRMSNSTITITNTHNGGNEENGKLIIQHNYSAASFARLTVRITDFYGTHSYTLT